MRRSTDVLRTALAAMLMLLSFASAEAQKPLSAKAEAGAALPPDAVDVGESKIFARVAKSGLGHEHGVAGRLKSGTIHLNQPANAGSLVFDLASFEADTPEARKFVGLPGEIDRGVRDEVNANLRGPLVLDVARFSTATFTIESSLPAPGAAGPSGVTRFRLVGKFTLHGVTKPLTLDCDIGAAPHAWRLRSKFTILQSDYGIKPFSKAFGAIGVADALTIWGEVFVATVARQQ